MGRKGVVLQVVMVSMSLFVVEGRQKAVDSVKCARVMQNWEERRMRAGGNIYVQKTAGTHE
jgi:cob(I)alamin adenosyltransferase